MKVKQNKPWTELRLFKPANAHKQARYLLLRERDFTKKK
jgi:hypothetical protein